MEGAETASNVGSENGFGGKKCLSQLIKKIYFDFQYTEKWYSGILNVCKVHHLSYFLDGEAFGWCLGAVLRILVRWKQLEREDCVMVTIFLLKWNDILKEKQRLMSAHLSSQHRRCLSCRIQVPDQPVTQTKDQCPATSDSFCGQQESVEIPHSRIKIKGEPKSLKTSTSKNSETSAPWTQHFQYYACHETQWAYSHKYLCSHMSPDSFQFYKIIATFSNLEISEAVTHLRNTIPMML